jgi:DNA mismatch repair protein MutL
VSDLAPIRTLPDDLANQIAAGEVVERPASVVKELVENALDASALRIDVAISGGGITSIRVSDDGHGMSEQDAPRALGRHATSKLRAFSDLEQIQSYGFRGEALPSVASVSRLSIRTRARGADSGLLVEVEGSSAPVLAPVGTPVGTTLEVRDLFFNVPARRKFLRSSNTESGHVGEVVVDAALSRPDVAFSFHRDGRKTKAFERVSTRRERVLQVLSEEELIAAVGERGPLRVEAYLSSPARARQGAGGLRLFVNGRPVRDRALVSTIAHAYGGVLERGRYPRGVVYLDIPGRLVDVNVHPQKVEVRFADARAVLDAVFSVVRRGLEEALGSESSRKESSPASPRSSPALPPSGEGHRVPVPAVTQGASRRSGRALRAPAPSTSPHPAVRLASPVIVPQVPLKQTPPPRTGATWRGLRLLGIARSRYLVCEGEDGIVLLDQHAAHERVLLAELRRDFFSGSVATQALLFPEVVSLLPSQVQTVEEWSEILRRLGLDVRVRHEDAVSIHSAPRLLIRTTAEMLLRQLLVDLARMDPSAPDLEPLLAHLACAEAIRPGDRLQREAAEGLLRSLLSVDFDVECKHGRVILTTTTEEELERKAGRA